MGIATDFVLILLAGLVGGFAARVLRLPLLAGYVAAGILVGPHTGGPRVMQVRDIELLAEIGVALLLFSLGLELSLRDLQPVRRFALLGGSLQIVVTCGATALIALKGLDIGVKEAIWFGAMISVSSTAVVLKTLSEAGVASTLASRVMVGLLVLQDLAVVPMLLLLPQLSSPGIGGLDFIRAIGLASIVLYATAVAGKRLLPRMLGVIAGWESRELFLVAVVTIGTGVGYVVHAAGLSFALGAFVAGLVLSESEFSHQALSDVTPLRDVFGLLFFVTVGMLLDPVWVLGHAGRVAAAVLAVFAGKALIIGALVRLFGYVNLAPWIVGFGLSQIGEFAFVLAQSGLSTGILSRDTYNLSLAVTVITMALSPVVSGLALPLGRAWQRNRAPAGTGRAMLRPQEPISGHVVIAGCGRVGQAAAQLLAQAEIPFVVVELDHTVFRDLRGRHLPAVWGDATSLAVLQAARISKARVLLLALPDAGGMRLCLKHAKRVNPGIAAIARAPRMEQVLKLQTWGADAVIQPEFESGMEMARQALRRFDPDESVRLRLPATVRAY
jgi:CPA2 family monovalent cation:H+ antiporter-2